MHGLLGSEVTLIIMEWNGVTYKWYIAKSHNRHPSARPQGWAEGCLLWVCVTNKASVQSHNHGSFFSPKPSHHISPINVVYLLLGVQSRNSDDITLYEHKICILIQITVMYSKLGTIIYYCSTTMIYQNNWKIVNLYIKILYRQMWI